MSPKKNDSILKIPYLNDSIMFTERDNNREEEKTAKLKELFIP